MKRAGWLVVWAAIPATAVLAITSPHPSTPIAAEFWIGSLLLLGSLAVAVIAVRRPHERRKQS